MEGSSEETCSAIVVCVTVNGFVSVSVLAEAAADPCFGLKNRRRRALLTTKTELKLMARAATIGFIFRPKAV